MATVFTRIIQGEIPGRFVWKDDLCVAFLTIAPLRPGHTLVVPRKEVDHWLDLDDATTAHLMKVAKAIGKSLLKGFKPAKVGLVIAGLEVRHVHLHVVPIDRVSDLDFARQDPQATAVDLDASAELIREGLRALGHKEATS
jgi:histidine triad (HIT) family protein